MKKWQSGRGLSPLAGLVQGFGDGFTSHQVPLPPNFTAVTSRLQVVKDIRHINQVLSFLESWRIEKLDPLLYRALMRLCAEAKALPEAQRVHAHIGSSGCSDSRFLCNELVYMYGRCESVDQARVAFQSIRDPDTWSYNSLLAAYTHNGHIHPALELFERMPEKNQVSWNTMLKAFIRHGFYQEAKDLFLEMPDRNVVTWNAMVTAYAENGYMDQALALVEQMPEVNVVTWNVIISGFTRQEDIPGAVLIFRYMLQEGVSPVPGTFFPLLQTLTALKLGREIHGLVAQSCLGDNLHLMNAVLEMYTRCGSLKDCVSALNAMLAKDVGSWSSMITAYSQAGELESAREIFDNMTFRDERALSAMAMAYAQHGHMLQARSLFEDLPEKPKGTLAALITGYGKVRDLVGAEALFESVPERDVLVWDAMLEAYAENGHPKEAIKLLATTDLEGIQTFEDTLITVFRGCADSQDGFRHGKLLHRQLRCEPLVKHSVHVQSSVLRMYFKQGSFVETCLVFSEMPVRDLESWTTIIEAYAQHGYASKTPTLLRFMNWEGIRTENSTLQALLGDSNDSSKPSCY